MRGSRNRSRLAAVTVGVQATSSHPGHSRWAIPRVLALSFALVVILAACAGPAAGGGPLVTVETRGGECFAAPCGATFVIDRDGQVRSAEKPPNVVGTVPSELMGTLGTLVATTNFELIKSRPFNGECPTNFDGQEIVYTFSTASGPETIATCEFEIDPRLPLFAAVHAALVAVDELPAS